MTRSAPTHARLRITDAREDLPRLITGRLDDRARNLTTVVAFRPRTGDAMVLRATESAVWMWTSRDSADAPSAVSQPISPADARKAMAAWGKVVGATGVQALRGRWTGELHAGRVDHPAGPVFAAPFVRLERRIASYATLEIVSLDSAPQPRWAARVRTVEGWWGPRRESAWANALSLHEAILKGMQDLFPVLGPSCAIRDTMRAQTVDPRHPRAGAERPLLEAARVDVLAAALPPERPARGRKRDVAAPADVTVPAPSCGGTCGGAQRPAAVEASPVPKATATEPAPAPAVPTVPAPAAWAQAGEWTTQASAGTLDALHASIAKFYGGSQKQLLPVMPNVWAVATPGGQVLEQMRVRLSPARGRSRFVFESLTPPAAAPAARAVQAPSGPPAGVDARQGALFSAFQSSLAAALPSILGTP